MGIFEKQQKDLESAANALVDASSFGKVIKWLEDNSFGETLLSYETPLDAVIGVLEHYKEQSVALNRINVAHNEIRSALSSAGEVI